MFRTPQRLKFNQIILTIKRQPAIIGFPNGFAMKIHLGFLAILTALLVSSCSSPRPKPLDLAKVRKAIEARNARWAEAVKKDQIDTLLTIYTDDVTVLPPNKPMAKGKDQLRATFSLMPARGVKITKASFTTLDVQGQDSTVLEIGQYFVDIQRPNMPTVSDTGKYSTVWKRQPDGTWKIYADCWNSSRPPQPPHPQK